MSTVAHKEPVDLAAIRARNKSNPWEGCSCGQIPHVEPCPRRALGDMLEAKNEDIRALTEEVESLRKGLRRAIANWEVYSKEYADMRECRNLLPPVSP